MDIRFADMDHLNFYKDICARAEAEGKRVDGYFRSLVYLCSLTPDTRAHFADIFDWEGWFIRPESLSAGWQTAGRPGRYTPGRGRSWWSSPPG